MTTPSQKDLSVTGAGEPGSERDPELAEAYAESVGIDPFSDEIDAYLTIAGASPLADQSDASQAKSGT